jgi:hypothetical protein
MQEVATLVPAGVPSAGARKALPSVPAVDYNPHSLQTSGSVQPVLPDGPFPVVGLFCGGPA